MKFAYEPGKSLKLTLKDEALAQFLSLEIKQTEADGPLKAVSAGGFAEYVEVLSLEDLILRAANHSAKIHLKSLYDGLVDRRLNVVSVGGSGEKPAILRVQMFEDTWLMISVNIHSGDWLVACSEQSEWMEDQLKTLRGVLKDHKRRAEEVSRIRKLVSL